MYILSVVVLLLTLLFIIVIAMCLLAQKEHYCETVEKTEKTENKFC